MRAPTVQVTLRLRQRELGATVAPAAHGYRLLVLDSPGGSVHEAMKVAGEIDALEMHTIVPAGASCQSACAAILFVSGAVRTVEEGGMLGLHNCYDANSGK